MIKSLFEILPIYEFEEKMEVSEWVKENQALGLIGEKIVKKYLEEKYDAIVTKMDDKVGYDFWVEMGNSNFAVEVKITETNRDVFFLTITELLKAYKLGELYNIYRVVKKDNTYKIYIINNPIDILDIDVEILKHGYENALVKIVSSDFKVILKDSFIESLPCVEISKIS